MCLSINGGEEQDKEEIPMEGFMSDSDDTGTEGDDDIHLESLGNPLCPVIKLSKEKRKELRKP